MKFNLKANNEIDLEIEMSVEELRESGKQNMELIKFLFENKNEIKEMVEYMLGKKEEIIEKQKKTMPIHIQKIFKGDEE